MSNAREKEEPSPLETLHRDRATLKTSLDAVTNLDAVPTEDQLDALLQSMDVFTRLELVPAPDDYLTLFQWQNLPGYLERLHIEVQVLRQECRKSDVPTRSLLEQQVSLKHTGTLVLNHLDELLASLQRDRDSSDAGREGHADHADRSNTQKECRLYPTEESMTCSAASCVENEEE